jgi:septal ring factor EnvC (AmiA/AmiB activator)
MIKRALLLLIGLGMSSPVMGQSEETLRNLTEASAQLAEASETLSNSTGFDSRIAALTSAIRAYEHGLTAMRTALRGAVAQERSIAANLHDERATLVQLLGVLAALENAPAPLSMLHPDGLLASARAGALMAAMTPELADRVATLSASLDQLRVINALRMDAETNLRIGLAELQQARGSLNGALDQRDADGLRQRLTVQPVSVEQLDTLLRATENLNVFAEGLAALPAPDLPGQTNFISLQGTLPAPVAGSILRGFNAKDAAGIARPGVIFSAQPLALVTTPTAATVRYAGEFLNYGLVLILEPAPDYLMTFTGLGRAFVAEGDVLQAGDPLGELGGDIPTAQEFLIETSSVTGASDPETLYMELRHQGAPVDPTIWLAPQE